MKITIRPDFGGTELKLIVIATSTQLYIDHVVDFTYHCHHWVL